MNNMKTSNIDSDVARISLGDIQKKLKTHEMDLRIHFHTLTKKEKDTLAKTVKLQEEVGELANDILASLSLQRKSKLETFKKRNMYEEFADIIISTVTLANVLGVDLDLAVKNKLEKVLNEYSKDR